MKFNYPNLLLLIVISITFSCSKPYTKEDAIDYFDEITELVGTTRDDFTKVLNTLTNFIEETKSGNGISSNDFNNYVNNVEKLDEKLSSIKNKLTDKPAFHNDSTLKNDCIKMVATTQEIIIPHLIKYAKSLHEKDSVNHIQTTEEFEKALLDYEKAEKKYETSLRNWANKYDD